MASFPGQLLADSAILIYQGHWTSHSGAVYFDNADTVPPEILNMSHPPGTPIYKESVVEFDLQDERGLNLVEIQVDQGTREVVFDGSVFLTPYLACVRITVIDNRKYHFAIRRTGGWIATPTWHLRILDAGFNQPLNP